MGKGISELETEHRALGAGFKTVWIKGPDAMAVVKKITTALKGDTQLVDVTAHKIPFFDWKKPLPMIGGGSPRAGRRSAGTRSILHHEHQ